MRHYGAFGLSARSSVARLGVTETVNLTWPGCNMDLKLAYPTDRPVLALEMERVSLLQNCSSWLNCGMLFPLSFRSRSVSLPKITATVSLHRPTHSIQKSCTSWNGSHMS